MTTRRTIAHLLIAALLLAVAGPGLAEARSQSQKSSDGIALKKNDKTAKRQNAGKRCNRVVPPFMRNPRYMNRGFFKCRERGQ